MKVLQIGCDNIGYGGRSMIIYNLSQAILSEDIKCDFLYFGNRIPDSYLVKVEEKGGRVIDAGNKFKGKICLVKEINRALSIKKCIRNNGYDIVHINADNAYEAFKSFLIVKNAGVKKIVVHGHTTGNRQKFTTMQREIIKLCQVLIGKKADSMLACSMEAAKYMFGKKADKAVILKNGIKLGQYAFDETVRKNKIEELGVKNKLVVGYVGRLTYSKNLDFLLEIFSKVHELNRESVLLIVGNGELLEEMQKKAQCLGIGSSVIFLGNRNDVNELLQAMDVFCLTSRYEGFGIVNIEAQASGLPCVISDAVPEMAKVNSNFIFMNVDQSADAWAREVYKKAQEQRIPMNDELKKSGYDISDSAEKLEEIYREIC